MKIQSVVAVLVLLAPRVAFCWGDTGHEIVGEVAEQNVSAETRNFVRGIIGVEPFAVAATWPDHVRDDDRFGQTGSPDHDFAPYHFCEIPVGYTYANEPRKAQKDCYGAITNAITLLKSDARREAKMIALRYLIHVIGDVHQPLHVGNDFDRGANSCQIRWQPKPGGFEQRVNLHTFWDTTLIDYLGQTYADSSIKKPAAKYYPDYVTVLRQKYPAMFTADAKKQYGEMPLSKWLAESADIREGGVYPGDAEGMKNVKKGEEYKNRPYCTWYVDQDRDRSPAPGSAIDPSKIPLVGRDYADHYTGVIELQLLKAGLRLAWTLDQIAKANSSDGAIDDGAQEQIIKAVQGAFQKTN